MVMEIQFLQIIIELQLTEDQETEANQIITIINQMQIIIYLKLLTITIKMISQLITGKNIAKKRNFR